MTTALLEKLTNVRDFRKILETTVKELSDAYSLDVSQIVLSNPLDKNITSICEYRNDPDEDIADVPYQCFPLAMQGGGQGMLTLGRRNPLTQQDINNIRITMAELADVVRFAQINDIVQRDTFRHTFLLEINNLMAYSLGLGDTLFMVVNILGKALNVSRAMFICVDDTKTQWKVYEFWQRERGIKNCAEYGWPTTASPIVAQSLLSHSPLIVEEGQVNSFLSPVQEELTIIGTRSLLGIPLRSDNAIHGCVILQQCESRHAWTRGEIDMVQAVADTVAEALAKLPEEKKAREPIMRLHQRDMSDASGGQKNIQTIRNALKGAFGGQAIPTAQKAAAKKPVKQPTTPGQINLVPDSAQPVAQTAAPPAVAAPTDIPPPPPAAPPEIPLVTPAAMPPPAAAQPAEAGSGLLGSLGDALTQQAHAPETADDATASAVASLNSLLGGMRGTTGELLKQMPGQSAEQPDASTEVQSPEPASIPPAPQAGPPLVGEPPVSHPEPGAGAAAAAAQAAPPPAVPEGNGSQWGDLDAIPTPGPAGAGPGPTPQAAPAAASAPGANQWGNLDSIPTPGAGGSSPTAMPASAQAPNQWGDLDAIPAPGGAGSGAGSATGSGPAQAPSQWGNLDAIQAPSAGGNRAGLGGLMGRKARGSGTKDSPLLASLHKDKSKFREPVTHVEGPPVQIDDAQAQAKIAEVLSASSSPTSDYVFATPGLGARTLGRIDGWISQVEQKDKYMTPHALHTAMWSVEIAKQMDLPPEAVETIRLAALVHDVGKLGLPPAVLQKADEELSDQELMMIMKHPIDGAGLLESNAELAALAPLVLSQHEEFDGNGYPAGLSGEAIPIGARIIHMAATYHSLISPLRYRPALPPAEAQPLLQSGSGNSFDPNVLQALVACINAGKIPTTLNQ